MNKRQRAIAYHEAGHAVAAYVHHVAIHRAAIIPSADFAGHVSHANPLRGRPIDAMTTPRDRRHMERLVIVALAGDAAQRRHAPRSVRSWHADQDRRNAADLVSYFVGSEAQQAAYLAYLWAVTDDLVDLHWPAVEAVAAELLERRDLSGKRVRGIIATALWPRPSLGIATDQNGGR